jgi:serine/threonine protein kinase
MSRALHKDRRFAEDRARVYLAEIILAMEDLHKRDIIFRDLKPDNIVFDEDGHALLTDFGLSKEGVLNNS